ncbi:MULTISPECIES: hypothetical protein [unclassified Rhizobium]|uniref:hypothetical protein n=1 Tax=unclassified Rhizobium TaxID=2613769 RepID=UPI0017829763|nr:MULTISPECIES: hypothetical protein [unclassified Rhizobium]MBD8686559.1 hypothetical protein [Rhizobium sp. CFBP 13644]MBD8691639.1 hypothetical protein [Rhizobium sp. CFBP 13717]
MVQPVKDNIEGHMRRAAATLAICLFGMEHAAAEQFGTFDCVSYSDFANASVKTALMRIGNFSINEKLAGTDLKSAGLLLAYAATNETSGLVYLASDFILLDAQGAPLAAINASPRKLFVEAGKSMIVDGSTIASAGTLAMARKVCIRIYLSVPARK